MSIGRKLRGLDDRVLGPARPSPVRQALAACAIVGGIAGNVGARAVLGDESPVNAILAVVVTGVLAPFSVRRARREGVRDVTARSLAAWWLGGFVVAALPPVLVPPLRDSRAGGLVVVLALAFVTDRLVKRRPGAAAGDLGPPGRSAPRPTPPAAE